MGLFDRRDSDPDSKHCGHPDQRAYEHTDTTTGKTKTIAYCPSCGFEWSE